MRPTGAWAAIWRWLRRGRRYGSGGFAFYSGPRRNTPWGIPTRVWRVFRHRQAVELTPIMYVVAVGGGLLIGVVLQLALGVWWWMPGAALLVALWLIEGSSAFWGGPVNRHPHTLRTELLAAFSPQRGGVARRAEDRAKLLGCGLPFFAPADWVGRVSFGGWGGSGRKLTNVSINCRTPGQEASGRTELAITTDAHDFGEDSVRRGLLRPRDGEGVWHPITMRIDGQDHSGWGLEAGGLAYRYARVGDCWVTVRGTAGIAALPLGRIDPTSVTGW